MRVAYMRTYKPSMSLMLSQKPQPSIKSQSLDSPVIVVVLVVVAFFSLIDIFTETEFARYVSQIFQGALRNKFSSPSWHSCKKSLKKGHVH